MRLINVIGSSRVCLDACGLRVLRIVDDAPVVLTPPAILMLPHLVRHTVIDARGDGTGLSGVVTRDALHKLQSAG